MECKCKVEILVKGLLIILITISLISIVTAAPIGPAVTYFTNSTKVAALNTSLNYSAARGYIHTINLESNQQNLRWKAFVGNVSGKLVLSDSSNYSIYDWSLTSQTGEVYASRSPGTVDWANINCSFTNATILENIAINHTTNPNDNISITFNSTNNRQTDVGTKTIPADSCPTTNLFVNSSAPSGDYFEQFLLYDGSQNITTSDTSASFTNIVYTSIIEQDYSSYANGTLYDFQILLPENGLATWTSATEYYFFIELA